MGCNSNKNKCNCPVKDLSTDCSTYTGDDLSCSGIKKGTIMTEVLTKLDSFICTIRDEVIKYLTIVNIGNGAKIYKGNSNIGEKEIRSLTSSNEFLLDIEENTDTINISPGVPELELTGDILSFFITTNKGKTLFGEVNLSDYLKQFFIDNSEYVCNFITNNCQTQLPNQSPTINSINFENSVNCCEL